MAKNFLGNEVTLLTLARAGGVDATPPPLRFFLDARRTVRRSALKLGIAYGASFAHLLVKKFWSGHVRSRSYDVIRDTASGRFFGKSRNHTVQDIVSQLFRHSQSN